MHTASMYGHVEAVRALIAFGAPLKSFNVKSCRFTNALERWSMNIQ
jgi:ankyrin repeat protein